MGPLTRGAMPIKFARTSASVGARIPIGLRNRDRDGNGREQEDAAADKATGPALARFIVALIFRVFLASLFFGWWRWLLGISRFFLYVPVQCIVFSHGVPPFLR